MEKKLKCQFSTCKHNASCCHAPSEEKGDKFKYCKVASLAEEVGYVGDDCDSYEPSMKKKLKCANCQMEDYGEIRLNMYRADKEFKDIIRNCFGE